MKERPILFSTPMVQAILAGRKTQTRRIIKQQPEGKISCIVNGLWMYDIPTGKSNIPCSFRCPYGQIGDVIWVRETWAMSYDTEYHPELASNEQEHWETGYVYKADGKPFYQIDKWKPSIFMPREACRLRLEITNIRVERLQEISHGDAMSEGVDHVIDKITGYCGYDYLHGGYNLMTNPYNGFCSLWKSINGKESWESNPYVWVIEFKKL